MDDPARRTLDIALHLELDGDELAGTATSAGGAVRPFAGWVGLLAALDALTAPPAAADPPRAPR